MSANEWISIKDHFHPIDENVLCYVDGRIYINSLVHSELHYLHYSNQVAHNYLKNKTTHWMKLPDAPKELTNVNK